MDPIRNPRRTSLICLLLGAITLAIFWPSLNHSFLDYDDQQYVTENSHVRAGLTWNGLLWAFRTNHAGNWHPLTWLSHMLDCQLYGLNPFGHHLSNLLLHIAGTLLLFLFLNNATGAAWRSAFVAALFAWHPLHVESVAWVAERKDVLSAFFWMLTVCSYAWYAAKPGTGRYLATLALFALGLMAKPMVVTLPFVLLLLDYWPLKRMSVFSANASQPGCLPWFRLVREKLPFLVLTAIACFLTVRAQRASHFVSTTGELPLNQRLPHVLISYEQYIAKAILPRRLAVFYPYSSAPLWEAVVAGVLLGLVSLAALKLASRRPYLLVGWFWFLGALVPVIGLVQVGDQALADRYSYLPLIGLFLIFVWGVMDMDGDGLLAKIFLAGVCAVAAVGCSLQLRYWKDTGTLFTHAARVTQSNYVAVAVEGSLQARQGNLASAVQLYTEALRYNPDYAEAHLLLGNVLEQQGHEDQAVAEYSTALRLKPYYDSAHIFLGATLAKQQKYDEALAHYQIALQLNPDSALAHHSLAKLYHIQGRLDLAAEHYAAALRLDPSLAAAHNNLGIIFLQQGRTADGAAQLKEALRLDPGNSETEYNLIPALVQMGRWDEAIDLCAKAGRARPDDPNLHYQWGLALAHRQKTRDAMSHLAHALVARPDFPDALDALAWILATDPRPELRNGTQAVSLAERACELTANRQPAMLLTLAAAYAEAGRFADATTAAQKAKDLALEVGQKETAAKCGKLLELFQSKQPYRETLD